MRIQDLLAQNYGHSFQIAAVNTEGMTQAHSLAHPARGGNCANWILGHLTNVQNGVMGLIGEKPVWENEQLKRAGFDPITQADEAIDWEMLRERFLGSRERCLAAIAKLSDDSLAETVPHPFGGTCSRAELLTTLAFHQAYHVGQLGVVRRVAGLDGVVKQPGQVQTV